MMTSSVEAPTVFYKGVRPDGRDFWSGRVQWAPERVKARKGRIVKHPTSKRIVTPSEPSSESEACATFLSVSSDPTELPCTQWPLRLLKVEPVGEIRHIARRKYGGLAFRVIEELDPALRFGPQGTHVAALIKRLEQMTVGEANRLLSWPAASREAAREARHATESAARAAAWDAALGPVWQAAGRAVLDADGRGGDAAVALVVRDLIGSHGFTQEHYDILTGPVRTVLGRIHPDDKELT